MKNKKFLGFVAIAIAVVGLAIYDYQSTHIQEKKKQEESYLLGMEADQIAKLTLKTKTEEIELHKDKEGWKLVRPIQELADPKATNDFLEGIASERSMDVAVEKENIEWASFGLDQPLGVISLTNNSGKEVVFTVGSSKNFQGDAFVRRNQENKVFVASSTWFPKFEKRAFDFRDKRLMKLPNAGAEQILMIRNQDQYKLEKKENGWVLAGQPGWKLDQNKVRELLMMLNQTEALEYIAEGDAKKQELRKWGLLSPRLKIQVHLQGGKVWEASFATGGDKVHRVWTKASEQVMKISPTDSDKFYQMTADSFRDRSEPFDFERSKVKEIEIKLGKNSQHFKASDEKAQELVKRLNHLQVADFKEFPKNSLEQEILLKDEKGELFKVQWGQLQSISINGTKTSVFPAKTSLYPKTFALMESDITSLKLDELMKTEKTP